MPVLPRVTVSVNTAAASLSDAFASLTHTSTGTESRCTVRL